MQGIYSKTQTQRSTRETHLWMAWDPISLYNWLPHDAHVPYDAPTRGGDSNDSIALSLFRHWGIDWENSRESSSQTASLGANYLRTCVKFGVRRESYERPSAAAGTWQRKRIGRSNFDGLPFELGKRRGPPPTHSFSVAKGQRGRKVDWWI